MPIDQPVPAIHQEMQKKDLDLTCIFDENRVRYRLVSDRPGHSQNWLFFPGGPGADSSYLLSLIDLLELPGRVWLVDLPGNGDNLEGIPSNYNYDTWLEIFLPTIKRFDRPIVVGHSFGAMLPLCFPEVEEILAGFVILNSAPSLWLIEAMAYGKQFDLPDFTSEMDDFTKHPSQETFHTALNACLPYYFPSSTLEKGRDLLSDLPFQYPPAVWWQHKVIETNFNAKWIPQKVPTLIIGGTYDCIVPFQIFENDNRFDRPNIVRVKVEEGGHMPWIENPEQVRSLFSQFCEKLEQ